MLTPENMRVFAKYLDAGAHAFSSGTVPDSDKDLYQDVFASLQEATTRAIADEPFDDWFTTWSARFGRDGGVQGQRPVDLWSSVINVQSEVFGRCPQIYVIASDHGLEIGFTVTIHEDDYYNLEVKQRQRHIAPVLYSKLPSPTSDFVDDINNSLGGDGFWVFGTKTRQKSGPTFNSLAELITFLKSPKRSIQGGGSIYRIIPYDQINSGFDLNFAFSHALTRFAPLMRMLTPTHTDATVLNDQQIVDKAAGEIPDFDPQNLADGRNKALREVAVRQGQAKFRELLIDAYKGRCAVTGTPIAATLQAAHIIPYMGPDTNAVQNGLLLRADIHNLFDLGLIQIHPETLVVSVADELKTTGYLKLEGRKLRATAHPKQSPNKDALAGRLKLFE